ncbi:MAG: hypothetical protein JWO06_1469 [Bacteroidota bacterium]|nr:hypothetical protein [Bacteroidota bacterium]
MNYKIKITEEADEKKFIIKIIAVLHNRREQLKFD